VAGIQEPLSPTGEAFEQGNAEGIDLRSPHRFQFSQSPIECFHPGVLLPSIFPREIPRNQRELAHLLGFSLDDAGPQERCS